MPDPVLPILSFTLAALGSLGTARNGMDLIIRDKDHVKGFVLEDLVLSSLELSLLSDQLDCWQRMWYVFDGMPSKLYDVYWGTSGRSQIMETLSRIEALSEDVAQEYQRRYGTQHTEAQKRFKDQKTLSKTERQHTLQTMIKDDRVRYSLGRRVKLAILDSPTFQRHLKTLRDLITKLESLSISKYEKQHRIVYDKNAVQQQGLRSLLLSLAAQAGQEFASLIHRCKQQTLPTNIAIDFHLDLAHGLCGTAREEYLTQRSRCKGFPYYLRLLEESKDSPITVLNGDSDYAGLNALCRELSRPAKPSDEPDEELSNSLGSVDVEGFDLLNRWPGVVQHDLNASIVRRYYRDIVMPGGYPRTPSRPSTPVESRRVAVEAPATESVRETLSRSSRVLLKSQFHHFSLAERYKLAYELCETALVLLATDSFCDLCICAIQRRRLDATHIRYEHYFRANNAHQPKNVSEDLGIDVRWCIGTELKDMHFRRLGIVLVEISTGRIMSDVRYDIVSQEIMATLEIAGTTKEQEIDSIADYVAEAAGVDMAHAVTYCLRGGASPEEVGSEDLAIFYNRVVAPYVAFIDDEQKIKLTLPLSFLSLHIHYRDQFLEPRRQDSIL